MTKLLLFLALAGLAALACGQEDNGNAVGGGSGEGNNDRPLILNHFKFLGKLLNYTCDIKEVLQDPDVNTQVYKIFDDLKAIWKEGAECLEAKLVAACNNKTRPIGKVFGIIHSDGEVASFRDIISSIRIFWSSMPFKKIPLIFNVQGQRQDFREFMKDGLIGCGGDKLENIRTDIKVLREKVMDIMKTNDPNINKPDEVTPSGWE